MTREQKIIFVIHKNLNVLAHSILYILNSAIIRTRDLNQMSQGCQRQSLLSCQSAPPVLPMFMGND